jgi:protein TonB
LVRELAHIFGVYTSVFEQSLLLNQDVKQPWNFLASLGGELLVISLGLIIPLLYSDHLPLVHWRDIIVGPPPSAPPPLPQKESQRRAATSTASPAATPRRFIWDPTKSVASPHPGVSELSADAPPAIGFGERAGNTNMLENFVPNLLAPPPPMPTQETHQPSVAPLRVGGDVQMAKLLRKVSPLYPQIAITARISGIVQLIGTIAKDGTIRNLQVISGHPILVQSAMEAVRQWVYKPTLLNGSPVEVIAPIQVSFTLGP